LFFNQGRPSLDGGHGSRFNSHATGQDGPSNPHQSSLDDLQDLACEAAELQVRGP